MTDPVASQSGAVSTDPAPGLSPDAAAAAAAAEANSGMSSQPATTPAATPPTRSGRWRVTWYIGLSALVPYAAIAGAMMVATPVLKQQLLVALMLYMALTVAFTGGMRWGAEVVRAGAGVPENRRLLMAGLTLLVALVAVLAAPLLEGDLSWQGPIAVLAGVAVLQLVWDGWSAARGRLPAWMGWFRLVATGLGLVFLSLTWWAAARISDTPPPPPPGFGTLEPADLGSPDTPDTPPIAPPTSAPPASGPAPTPVTPAAPASQSPLPAPPIPFPSTTAPPAPAQTAPPAAAPAPAN